MSVEGGSKIVIFVLHWLPLLLGLVVDCNVYRRFLWNTRLLYPPMNGLQDVCVGLGLVGLVVLCVLQQDLVHVRGGVLNNKYVPM